MHRYTGENWPIEKREVTEGKGTLLMGLDGILQGATLSGETLPGETIRRAKFSSPSEQFVTFA